jgi:hypothetical protein
MQETKLRRLMKLTVVTLAPALKVIWMPASVILSDGTRIGEGSEG